MVDRMAGLLSGLAKLGLGSLEDLEVFKPEETGEEILKEVSEKKEKEPKEEDFLYDRSYVCPVCESQITSKTVRTGKVKVIGADLDLRPRYQQLDMLKYDIVMCRHCGYASLNRTFENVSEQQAMLIKSKISSSFRSQGEDTARAYTYDEAIERYKLALASSIIKQDKASERAYLCLKTAWVIRGKKEYLEQTHQEFDKAELLAEEKTFLKSALEGFLGARRTETFPMCGMDEMTVDYVISTLAVTFEQYDVAKRMIGVIYASQVANSRLKEKARELQEVIRNAENSSKDDTKSND